MLLLLPNDGVMFFTRICLSPSTLSKLFKKSHERDEFLMKFCSRLWPPWLAQEVRTRSLERGQYSMVTFSSFSTLYFALALSSRIAF